MNKSKLKKKREFVGNNFFHFAVNHSTTYYSFIIFFGILSVFLLPLWSTKYFNMGLFLLLLSGILFSLFAAAGKRKYLHDKNKFIDNLLNLEPVHETHVTEKFHNLINECVDSEETVFVKTKVGVFEIKAADIPNLNPSPIFEG